MIVFIIGAIILPSIFTFTVHGSQAGIVDINHAFHLYYKCCMWIEFQSIPTWLRGFPPSSKLTPSLFQFDRMQDLPENHIRVSGASWVNIINNINYFYYMICYTSLQHFIISSTATLEHRVSTSSLTVQFVWASHQHHQVLGSNAVEVLNLLGFTAWLHKVCLQLWWPFQTSFHFPCSKYFINIYSNYAFVTCNCDKHFSVNDPCSYEYQLSRSDWNSKKFQARTGLKPWPLLYCYW